MAQLSKKEIGVVLAGHGAPATDCPPRLVGELMGLEWSGSGDGHGQGGGPDRVRERISQLDSEIRNWPRQVGNDPYKEGLEKLAAVLRPLLPPGMFVIGYNEFSSPSVPEAIEELIRQGVARVLVVPSMMTPGGLHSEVDIPRSIRQMQERHPAVSIEYLWPFDLKQVAALLASQVKKALDG